MTKTPRHRDSVDDFGRPVDLDADWDDLTLPAAQTRQLREIVARLCRVRDAGGQGIAALFTGASGTGKTLAAQVIAAEAGLDLYRIDWSKIVSKYIGETEKNLERLFDGAEAGGPILLFDEADALFGKRTDVHDSHDHTANAEIGYLLQRLESYRGLGILTAELKDRIDPSLLGRFRFVVEFPCPGS